MRSKGFVAGFNKTAGPESSIGKKVVGALGGKWNIGFTGLGAVTEGMTGYKKLTNAAVRT